MRKGFTLIELLLILGIVSLLVGFTLFSMTTALGKNITATAVTVMISDIKEQQLKAMIGDSEGRATADSYGIHFEQNRYILFHGSTYNQASADNFIIDLDSVTEITDVNLPNDNVIFSQASGEVSGFVNGQNTITLTNTATNEQQIITINRIGTITSVTESP